MAYDHFVPVDPVTGLLPPVYQGIVDGRVAAAIAASTASGVADGSITDAKVSVNAGISFNKIADTAAKIAMLPAERQKLTGISAGATVNAADSALRDRTTHTGFQLSSTISDLYTVLDARLVAAAGNSIASLVNGKIPTAQIPVLALSQVFTATSTAGMIALSTQEGDVIVVTINGTPTSYVRNSGTTGTLNDYTILATPGAAGTITSVNGQTSSSVVLGKGDVGLGNVDNTSDVNKPITAAQTATFAPLSNPTLSGVVTVPIPTVGTAAANKTYVDSKLTGSAPTANPTFTGAVTVPSPAAATSAVPKSYVDAAVSIYAPIASPTLTGTVTVPTPIVGTAAATKNYVDAQVAAVATGGYRDLGAGPVFPTTAYDGSPLQDNDAFDYIPAS